MGGGRGQEGAAWEGGGRGEPPEAQLTIRRGKTSRMEILNPKSSQLISQ